MDWTTSVSAACSAASEAIARTLLAVNRFVREVRESRSEFDGISTELHSLDGVLDLLGYDAEYIPVSLAEPTPAVLETCLALLNELEGCISLLNRPDVPRPEKRSRWLASCKHVDTLRWTLSEYKLVLGLAADLVGVTKSQANDAAKHGLSDGQENAACEDGVEDHGLAVVTARISEVSSTLKDDFGQSVALARLGQYLDILRAETHVDQTRIQTQPTARRPHRTSSMGGAPDSAIDMSYDDMDGPAFRWTKQTRRTPSTSFLAEPWEEEEEEDGTDEFIGELNEMRPRAPPVPPRSASRMSSMQRPSTADMYTDPRPSPSPSWPSTPRLSTSSSEASQRPAHDSYFTPVTELPPRTIDLPFRPGNRTHRRGSSVFSQVLDSVWEHPRADVPSPSLPPSRGGDTPQPDRQSSLLRRSGSKLSSTFRGLGRRRPSLKAVADVPEVETSAVFGVPLAKSIQVAKGVASARNGTGGAATREYPLSVLRCVYHIRDCGLDLPHIFGMDGDQARLAQLKEVFSSAETSYGKELDWSQFSVHDAANLILAFLSELPKPIISESVAKRWISLSRQAAMGGVRLDQGLDFWEEALMGVQGHGRALFKLLLNLWGDLADVADANQMTAERLAGRVIRSLMHATAARRQTDFMLALAFLIRKRSEYSLAARGVTRKSNAAF